MAEPAAIAFPVPLSTGGERRTNGCQSVIPVFVTGIYSSAISATCCPMEPGNKCRDDMHAKRRARPRRYDRCGVVSSRCDPAFRVGRLGVVCFNLRAGNSLSTGGRDDGLCARWLRPLDRSGAHDDGALAAALIVGMLAPHERTVTELRKAEGPGAALPVGVQGRKFRSASALSHRARTHFRQRAHRASAW